MFEICINASELNSKHWTKFAEIKKKEVKCQPVRMASTSKCRLCLAHDDDLLNIFSDFGIETKISDIINEHFKCEVTEANFIYTNKQHLIICIVSLFPHIHTDIRIGSVAKFCVSNMLGNNGRISWAVPKIQMGCRTIL